MIDWSEIRQKFQSLILEERQEFIGNLSDDEKLSLYDYPQMFLFDRQIVTGLQNLTLFICGRGWGKTFCGSGWIAMKVMEGAKKLAIIAPTYEKDLEQVMVPAILAWFPPDEAKYVGGMIKFTKYDAVIYCYSAETEVRGPNIEYCWCDEIAKWNGGRAEDVSETFKVATTACRIGKNPQIVVTSTPKPFPLIIEWERKCKEGSPLYKMIVGTMYDNPFLSDSYKQFMEDQYKDTPWLMRQELLGEIQSEVEGAAWKKEDIDNNRITMKQLKDKFQSKITNTDEKGYVTYSKPFDFNSTVVGVDPTVSDNPDRDECGIMPVAIGTDNHIYVLGDMSGQYTTDQWAKKSVEAVDKYDAGRIIIEKNNGGELVAKNIRIVDPNIPIKTITATKGKIDRALPVAALYAQGLVHHVMPDRDPDPNKPYINPFEKLEYQMTHFTGNPKEKSPDRLDALVWAIYELRLNQTYVYRDTSAIGMY